MNFQKGDWVTLKDFDSIPFKLARDPYEVSHSSEGRHIRTDYVMVVSHPRTSESIPVAALRVAVQEDFLKSLQRMRAKIKAVEVSIEDINALFNTFLTEKHNLD